MFFLNFHRKNARPCHGIAPGDVTGQLMPFAEPDRGGFFEDHRVLLVQCINWNTAASNLEPARYLHRRAIDGVAPKMVVWKPSKNMGNIMGRDFGGETSIPEGFVENLHPALKELLDVEKLADQAGNADFLDANPE